MRLADLQQGSGAAQAPLEIASDVVLLRDFADCRALWLEVQQIASAAPFRRMCTPGGRCMSAAMTNCGPWGWISDARGYRYSRVDPLSGSPWPALPRSFDELAARASAAAGFDELRPDACLLNQYVPGARMGSHQDRDEQDLRWPIVSVSLGIDAVFEWFGARRSGPSQRVTLHDGDVLVWGRSARLGFHAIRAVAPAEHAQLGAQRINLTMRKARS